MKGMQQKDNLKIINANQCNQVKRKDVKYISKMAIRNSTGTYFRITIIFHITFFKYTSFTMPCMI
jgi:hypothetical protein